MATFYAPSTLEALMQSMPDLQKKKRRAESLRKTQEKFEKQAATAQARGPQNFVPQQQGGLFPTVQQYQPDMGNAAQQGIGALGSYLTGNQAEGAQGEYDEAQSQAALRAAQQFGGMDPAGVGVGLEAAQGQQQGTVANEAALRAYMTMIGGPELAKALGTREDEDQVQSTFTDDSGEKYLVMKSGNVRGTGKKADFGGQIITDERTGQRFLVPKTGKYRGQSIPLDSAVGNLGEITGGGGGSAPLGTLDREDLHARQMKQESGGNPNAVSKAGARGLMQIMPDTARDLAAQMGVPVEQIFNDPATNEKAGRLYMDQQLEKYGGDQEAALIAYNAGPGNADKWLEAGRDYSVLPVREETEPYVRKILGQGTQGGPSTDGSAVSGPAALTQQQKDQSKADVKARAAAKASRGKIKDLSSPSVEAIDLLLAHPGLEKVLSGNTGSFVGALGAPGGDKDELGIIEKLARPAYARYDSEGADALALMDQVLAGPFATGFFSLTGQGAGSISNTEGQSIKNAISSMSTAQSPAAFKAAAARYKKLIQDIDARLGRVERGEEEDLPPEETYNVPRTGLKSQQNPDDDALINKYLVD